MADTATATTTTEPTATTATTATPPTTLPAQSPYNPPNIFDQKYGLVQGLNELMNDISDSIVKLGSISKVNDSALLTDYKTLQGNIKLIRDTYATTDFTTLTAQLQQSKDQKAPLDARRDTAIKAAENIVATPLGFMKTIQRQTLKSFLAIFMYISVFLAGLSMSHIFIATSLMYRAYYFILGAAFFPIVLVYTIYSPPVWRSALFPLFEKGELSAETERATFGLLSFYKPNPVGDKEMNYSRIMLRGLSLASLFFTGGAYWLLNRPTGPTTAPI